ncbi:HlyD family secretion protein [Peribacillus simplex]
MRKWIWWLVGGVTLLIVIVGASINLFLDNKKEIIQVETAKVETKKLKTTTLASGQVFPSEDSKLFLDTSIGKMAKLEVKEGQKVKEGEELFRYNNEELDLQLKQNEMKKKRNLIDLEQQNEKIKQLEKRIEEAKNDNLPDETIKQLTSEKEEIKYQNRLSNLDYSETLKQIESTEEKKKQLIVKSPITGVIKDVNEDASVGNIQNPDPFIYIISSDPYIIKGTITEYDFNFLKNEQLVTVKPKALPNKSFQGKIQNIENVPVEEGENTESVTSYPFSATLENTSSELQNGFHVSIEIEIAKENTLVIPSECVKTTNGKSYVFTENEGIAKMKKVVTGETHSQWIEIVSGIKEGDTVITNKLNQLSNNMEVTMNDPTK